MAQTNTLPHIYYTVTELSSVRDVKLLENVNVKTLAFVSNDTAYDIEYTDSTVAKNEKSLKLDMTYVHDNFDALKPCLILGYLYTLNRIPHVFVKSIKQFDENSESLITYHHQLLAIRLRSPHFKNFKESPE